MRVVTRLRHIHKIKRRLANGGTRTHFYHRPTGTRLPDDPTSTEFVEAWRTAEAAMAPKGADNIARLIDRFCGSSDWAALRDSTRSIMAINLAAVGKEYGALEIEALSDPRMRADFLDWRDRVALKYPRAADARLAALQRVLGWARDRGLISDNPLHGFKRAYRVDRSGLIWLPQHVEAMEASAPAEIVLAMQLALHTGQRQGDLLRLTWAAWDGKGLTVTQSKARHRRPIYIPATKALRGILDGIEGRGLYILARKSGRPWSADSFKKAWSASFEVSGIRDDLHYHDLRGTAVTMLAETGCSVPEICSITGHSLASATRILEVYLSRTRALAEAAIARLDEHHRNKGKA